MDTDASLIGSSTHCIDALSKRKIRDRLLWVSPIYSLEMAIDKGVMHQLVLYQLGVNIYIEL